MVPFNPVPTFHINADPDPAFQISADPDTALHYSDASLRPLVYILKTLQGSILSLYASIVSVHRSILSLLNFDFSADPAPAFHFNMASKIKRSERNHGKFYSFSGIGFDLTNSNPHNRLATGGILTLALALGKTTRECQALYFRLKDQVFVGKRPYEVGPLEALLKKEFGEDTTMGKLPPTPRILVTGGGDPILRGLGYGTLWSNARFRVPIGYES